MFGSNRNVAVVVFALFAALAHAQDAPVWKVGDRVEARRMCSGETVIGTRIKQE